MTSVLSIKLFGPLVLEKDGRSLLKELNSAKAQGLFCFLLLNRLQERPQPRSRQSLAALLWDALPEADARRNLRGVILRLRQVLDPYLLIDAQQVDLNNAASIQLDAEEFLRLTTSTASLEQLETAVAFYRGELLQEFSLRQAPSFELWLTQERAFWRQRALDAYERISQVQSAAGNFPASINAAHAGLALDGTREQLHRHIMRMLVRLGDRAGALAQFARCRDLLADELGMAVSAETAALAQQIRVGEVEIATPISRPLSIPAVPSRPQLQTWRSTPFIAGPPLSHPAQFFGRERALKRLFHLVRQRPLQNAAIIGPRRSGKTSLLHYLRNIHTIPAGQLRPGQRQDWLPADLSYRWIFIDFQDPRLGNQHHLLTTLLGQMNLPVPAACNLELFLEIVSDSLQTPTIILLDEMGVALSRYPQLDDRFWESMRSLATNQVDGNLGFVLTSDQSPASLAQHRGYGSPFFNIFGYTAVLGALSETAARELINSAPLPVSKTDEQWLLHESKCWPLPLQILCREWLLAAEEGEQDGRWRQEGLRQIAPFMEERS